MFGLQTLVEIKKGCKITNDSHNPNHKPNIISEIKPCIHKPDIISEILPCKDNLKIIDEPEDIFMDCDNTLESIRTEKSDCVVRECGDGE